MSNPGSRDVTDSPSPFDGNSIQRIRTTTNLNAEFWKEAGIQSFIDDGLERRGPFADDSASTLESPQEEMKGISGSLKVLFEDFQVYEDAWLPTDSEISPHVSAAIDWSDGIRDGETDTATGDRSMRSPLRLTELVDRSVLQRQREETQRLFSGEGLISPAFTLEPARSTGVSKGFPTRSFLSAADCLNIQSFVRTLALALPPPSPASSAEGTFNHAHLLASRTSVTEDDGEMKEAKQEAHFHSDVSEFEAVVAAASEIERGGLTFDNDVSGEDSFEQGVKRLALQLATKARDSSSQNPLLELESDAKVAGGEAERDAQSDASNSCAASGFVLPSLFVLGSFSTGIAEAAEATLEAVRHLGAEKGNLKSVIRSVESALPVRLAAAETYLHPDSICSVPWSVDQTAIEGFCKTIRTKLHAAVQTVLPFALTAAVSSASLPSTHSSVLGPGSPPFASNFVSSLQDIHSEDAAAARKHGFFVDSPECLKRNPFVSLEANWSLQRKALQTLESEFRKSESRLLKKEKFCEAAVFSAAACTAAALSRQAPEQLLLVSLRFQCLKYLFKTPLQHCMAHCSSRGNLQSGGAPEAEKKDELLKENQPDSKETSKNGVSEIHAEETARRGKRMQNSLNQANNDGLRRRRKTSSLGSRARSGDHILEESFCCEFRIRRAAAKAVEASARQDKWRNSQQTASSRRELKRKQHRVCYVLLEKQNRDTSVALHALASALRLPTHAVKAAATKDRRAVTTQLVSVSGVRHFRLMLLFFSQCRKPYRMKFHQSLCRICVCVSVHAQMDWPDIASATLSPAFDRNLQLQFIGYGPSALHLGQLRGNFFQIILRNVRPATKTDGTRDERPEAPSMLSSKALRNIHFFVDLRATQLRHFGFLNYFGLQRFGSLETKTHRVGVLLLKRDYPAAVKAILALKIQQAQNSLRGGNQTPSKDVLAQSQRDEANESFSSVKSEKQNLTQQTGGVAKNSGPAECLWISFARFEHLEELLLNALGAGASYREALLLLPAASLQLYIHSAQALLFNHLLTYRWSKYGSVARVGDLIAERLAVHSSSETAASAESGFVSGEEESDCTGLGSLSCARFLETAAAANAANMEDLVLPLVGHESLLPEYLRTEAEQICMRELGIPLSTFTNYPSVNQQTRGARYRQEIQRLQELRKIASARTNSRSGRRGLLSSEVLTILAKADARENSPCREDQEPRDAPLPVLNLKGGYRKMVVKPKLCEWQFALTAKDAESPPLPLLLSDLDLARRKLRLARKTNSSPDPPKQEMAKGHEALPSAAQTQQHVLPKREVDSSGLCAEKYKEMFGISWDSPLNPLRFLDCRNMNPADALTIDQVAGSAGESLVQVFDSRSTLALVVRLWLPPGAYCTVALRELMKDTTSEL